MLCDAMLCCAMLCQACSSPPCSLKPVPICEGGAGCDVPFNFDFYDGGAAASA